MRVHDKHVQEANLRPRALIPPRTISLGLLVLAIAACLAWLGQVVWCVGWAGLAWTSLVVGPETLPSCTLVALAVALPWHDRFRGHWGRALALVLALTGLGWGAGQLAFPFFAGIYSPFFGLSIMELGWVRALAFYLAVPIGVALVFSLACWGLLRGLAGPVRLRGLLLLPLALALVVPVTQVLILVLPALNGSSDLIHAVKMGYPQGFTALLLGTASWFARPGPTPELGGQAAGP